MVLENIICILLIDSLKYEKYVSIKLFIFFASDDSQPLNILNVLGKISNKLLGSIRYRIEGKSKIISCMIGYFCISGSKGALLYKDIHVFSLTSCSYFCQVFVSLIIVYTCPLTISNEN